jgi:hypothetical protein
MATIVYIILAPACEKELPSLSIVYRPSTAAEVTDIYPGTGYG